MPCHVQANPGFRVCKLTSHTDLVGRLWVNSGWKIIHCTCIHFFTITSFLFSSACSFPMWYYGCIYLLISYNQYLRLHMTILICKFEINCSTCIPSPPPFILNIILSFRYPTPQCSRISWYNKLFLNKTSSFVYTVHSFTK